MGSAISKEQQAKNRQDAAKAELLAANAEVRAIERAKYRKVVLNFAMVKPGTTSEVVFQDNKAAVTLGLGHTQVEKILTGLVSRLDVEEVLEDTPENRKAYQAWLADRNAKRAKPDSKIVRSEADDTWEVFSQGSAVRTRIAAGTLTFAEALAEYKVLVETYNTFKAIKAHMESTVK